MVTALAAAGASVAAQAATSRGSTTRRLTQVLDALPSDALATGVLADRVVQLAPFADHDGSPAAKPATGATFRQLLSQYVRASRAENATARIAELDQRAREAARSGIVPLAVLDFRFDRISATGRRSSSSTVSSTSSCCRRRKSS